MLNKSIFHQKRHKLILEGHYIGLALVFGPAVGVAIGTALDSIGVGIGIGVGVGIAIGSGLDSMSSVQHGIQKSCQNADPLHSWSPPGGFFWSWA